jgi:TfoX/Sxy family transcriptional regulator of competence genes
MPYNQALAERVSKALADVADAQEKRMFGGVGYLVQGNMACGILGDDLIVRVGPQQHAQALSEPHTRPFDQRGRPMVGWATVQPGGWASDEDLRAWVGRGVAFALTLPPKEGAQKRVTARNRE